jgi:hypothetical protein
MRSLQRELHKDEAGRRIGSLCCPLFFDAHTEDDQAAGTIYVLRSKSEHPMIAREWFLAPLFVIDEAVKKSGTVRFHVLDTIRKSASLVEIDQSEETEVDQISSAAEYRES